MIGSEQEEATRTEKSFENLASAGEITGRGVDRKMSPDTASPVRARHHCSASHFLLLLKWPFLGHSNIDSPLLRDFLIKILPMVLSSHPISVFRKFL